MRRKLTLTAFAWACTATVGWGIAYVALRGIMARPSKKTPHKWSKSKFGECYCPCGWRRMSNSDHSYTYQHTKTDRKRNREPPVCMVGQ